MGLHGLEYVRRNPQNRTKTAQEAPKRHRRRPKRAPRLFKTRPRQPKTGPRQPLARVQGRQPENKSEKKVLRKISPTRNKSPNPKKNPPRLFFLVWARICFQLFFFQVVLRRAPQPETKTTQLEQKMQLVSVRVLWCGCLV